MFLINLKPHLKDEVNASIKNDLAKIHFYLLDNNEKARQFARLSLLFLF
jgi:hypothetical protein